MGKKKRSKKKFVEGVKIKKQKLIISLTIILFLFTITQDRTNAINSSKREYVVYIDNTVTVLEGIVVDNETGERIEGTRLIGEAHSKIVPLSMKTNKSGYFETTLPNSLEPGIHHFFLDASANAYDNKRISGTILVNEIENIVVKLNYHPFDLALSKENGEMTRGWKENKYIHKKIENFTDTRQVVDHYEEEPQYRISSNPSFHSQVGAVEDLKDYSKKTLEKLGNKNEKWWLKYCQTHPNGMAFNYDMESNSQQDFEYGFQHFQGFISWQLYPVQRKFYEKTYYVQIPLRYRYLEECGKYEIPVYREEEYTRWRTKTYEITDHFPENWENKKFTVTAIPRNNYDNKIILLPGTENGISAKAKKTVLIPNSPAKTTISINPSAKIHGSIHPIKIEGYNPKGRHVQTKQYNLNLTTEPKPATENKKIDETVTDKKPDETGKKKDGDQKNKIGVMGILKDSKTNERLHHGAEHAKVHVKRNNYSGYAGWPTNTQYQHSQYTYNTKTWTMKLTADADGYLPKKGTAKDSTSKAGLTYKNFHLNQEDGW